VYYVKAVTRSSGGSAKGTPRRAIGYITDGHDARREARHSEAEVRYIARLGEGWKTELEGGRVPLVGFGILAGITNLEELTARFEGACQPWHDRRGTTGYKSFTFTLPKEVSLLGEGRAEEVRAAMYAGVREALARAFPDKDVAAVAAIHTRNEAGEIHFHAHVLVAKFALDRTRRRMVSLNSQAGGNSPTRIRDLKLGWKETVDRELGQRLGLRIEQPAPFKRPALVLEDGTKLPPLDRESRRQLDKQLSPTYTETTASGEVVRRMFRLHEAMDGRIFEVASGFGGEGWSVKGFLELAPAQKQWVSRYEKRVETLKRIGYLTADGKVTPAFRRHYSVARGIDTPELQRMRLDLARLAAKRSAREGRPVAVPSLLEAVDRHENIRRRVERLGLTREELKRIHQEADKRRPTTENLRLMRKQFEREALLSPPRELPPLPRTKTVSSAYVGYQSARVRAIGLVVLGVLRLQYTKHRKIASAIRAGASRDLFYAKERRLAQVGVFLRPTFWAARLILPRQIRRLELAIARCVALARTQEVSREWRRRFIAERKQRLLDARAAAPPDLGPIREAGERSAAPPMAMTVGRNDAALALGLEVMRRHSPPESALLDPWRDKLSELDARVAAMAKGRTDLLPPNVYESALRAGRAGNRLQREKEARPVMVPANLGRHEKEIQRVQARFFAVRQGELFSREMLLSLSPRRVEAVLQEVRQQGLADEGSGWALKQRELAALVKNLLPTLKREMDRER
jgi:hypothetical protein